MLKIYRRGLHTNEKLEKDTTNIKDKSKTKDKIKEKHKDDKKLQKIVSYTFFLFLLKLIILNDHNIVKHF